MDTNFDRSTLITRIEAICGFPNEAEKIRIVSGLRWIGLFSTEAVVVRGGNLLDTLCARLEGLMKYEQGERDLVMLQHKFVVEWADGKEVRLFPPSLFDFSCLGMLLLISQPHIGNPHINVRGLRQSVRPFGDGVDGWVAMWDCGAVGVRRGIEDARRACAVYKGNLRSD